MTFDKNKILYIHNNSSIVLYFSRNAFVEKKIKIIFNGNQKAVLKHLGHLYEKLNQIVDDVNSHLGKHVLLSITVYFVFIVFTFFSTYIVFHVTDENTRTSVTLNIIFLIIFSGIFLYVIAIGSILQHEVCINNSVAYE